MKRIWAAFFLLCCCCHSLLATSPIDSLQNLLKSTIPDTLRLRALNELAYQTSETDVTLSLEYADAGLKLADQLQDQVQKRQILHLKGLSHYKLGNYDLTLYYFRQVLSMFEKENNEWGISKMLNNLGILYSDLNQPETSLRYYEKSLSIKVQLKDSASIPNTLCNIGLIYLDLDQAEKAKEYFKESLVIDRKLGNQKGLAFSYEYMGQAYSKQQEYDSALLAFKKSLELLEKEDSRYDQMDILNKIAGVYLKEGQPEEAIRKLETAVGFGEAINARLRLKDSYQLLAEAFSQSNDYKNAFLYHQKYIALKDSIFNEENLKKISDIESNYQIQKREKEIELLKKDAQISSLNMSRNQMVSYYLYIALFVFFSLAAFLYQRNNIKNKSNSILQKRNEEISTRNKHITSSITYAKTIQEAILPQENRLLNYFPDSFVLSRPRDIVNGDFFWFYPSEDFYLLAVVDCTGHGVPGAFMTMMANSLLNQTIIDNKIFSPGRILRQLHIRLQNSMHNEQGFRISKDGLDLVICRIDKTQKQITYASAKRPLYYLENEELTLYRGNKSTLGGPLSQLKEEFLEKSFPYSPGSSLYLFTDGLTDQFGEKSNKKFLPLRLRRLILQVHQLPMRQQKKAIEEKILDWQGQIEQTDDMLVLGLRL